MYLGADSHDNLFNYTGGTKNDKKCRFCVFNANSLICHLKNEMRVHETWVCDHYIYNKPNARFVIRINEYKIVGQGNRYCPDLLKLYKDDVLIDIDLGFFEAIKYCLNKKINVINGKELSE